MAVAVVPAPPPPHAYPGLLNGGPRAGCVCGMPSHASVEPDWGEGRERGRGWRELADFPRAYI